MAAERRDRREYSKQYEANPKRKAYNAQPDIIAKRAVTTRKSHLKRKYGLTTERYDQLSAEQDKCCAVCKKPETRVLHGVIARLCVDHCHKTGVVRQLLCFNCNKLLGVYEQNITLFNKIKEYQSIHDINTPMRDEYY
jgi:hypothetical protein